MISIQFTLINSYEDYRSITKGSKFINNSFLPNEIKNYILKKRLYYFEARNQLFLFYDEKEYYQLVCGIIESNDMVTPISFESLKPIVCHIVENNKNNLIPNVIKTLQKSGFHLRCTIHEHVRENMAELPVVSSTSFMLCNEINNSAECQNILALWQNNLPVYEVTYMFPDDVKMLADKKQVLYLKDLITGKIAGACYYDIFLGTTTIHHIVVDPFFRGKGCACILLTAWLEQAKLRGAKVARSWIEDTNTSSQKSFAKVGFNKTANISYQYVKFNEIINKPHTIIDF